LIAEIMKSVMKEGEHFGHIPGCGPKKCLFLAGAQKLALTFRLSPRYRITETKLDNGHREFQVLCLLWTMNHPTLVPSPPGQASTMESKSRNRQPADLANTVLKMAVKRSFVAAVITALAASDIFTQDVTDNDNGPREAALQTLREAAENGLDAMRTAWKSLPL